MSLKLITDMNRFCWYFSTILDPDRVVIKRFKADRPVVNVQADIIIVGFVCFAIRLLFRTMANVRVELNIVDPYLCLFWKVGTFRLRFT